MDQVTRFGERRFHNSPDNSSSDEEHKRDQDNAVQTDEDKNKNLGDFDKNNEMCVNKLMNMRFQESLAATEEDNHVDIAENHFSGMKYTFESGFKRIGVRHDEHINEGHSKHINKIKGKHIGEIHLKHIGQGQFKHNSQDQEHHLVEGQYADESRYKHDGEYFQHVNGGKGMQFYGEHNSRDVIWNNASYTDEDKYRDANKSEICWNNYDRGTETAGKPEQRPDQFLEIQPNTISIEQDGNATGGFDSQGRCCFLHYPKYYKSQEMTATSLTPGPHFNDVTNCGGNNSDDQKMLKRSSVTSTRASSVSDLYTPSRSQTLTAMGPHKEDVALLTQGLRDIDPFRSLDRKDFEGSLMIPNTKYEDESLLSQGRRDVNESFQINERNDIDKALVQDRGNINYSGNVDLNFRSYFSELSENCTAENQEHRCGLMLNRKRSISTDSLLGHISKWRHDVSRSCKAMANNSNNILAIPSYKNDSVDARNKNILNHKPYAFHSCRNYPTYSSSHKTLKHPWSDSEKRSSQQSLNTFNGNDSKKTTSGLFPSLVSYEGSNLNSSVDNHRDSNEELLGGGCVPQGLGTTTLSTNVDPFSARALSLIHVPQGVTGYGFSTPADAPHTLRVDEAPLHGERPQQKLKTLITSTKVDKIN